MVRSVGLILACALLALAMGAANRGGGSLVGAAGHLWPDQSITFPEVAVNASGDAVAVWPRDDGAKRSSRRLNVRLAATGRSPVVLSDPAGEDELGRLMWRSTRLETPSRVWSAFDSGSMIRTATRPAGASGRIPRTSSPRTGERRSWR